MRDHEVRSGVTGLEISPTFNAAVPFIDRHLHEGRGAKTAIRAFEGREVTYAQLAEGVNRWARVLGELGVRPGDRQLMVMQDCPEFFFVFWGSIKAGVIPVPVSTLLRSQDYRYMIEDSGARVLVYSGVFEAELDAALSGGRAPTHRLTVDEVVGLCASEDGGELEPYASKPEDDCFWLYSSGSTGFPKGVVHRHRSMAVTGQSYGVEVLGLGEHDICYSAAKLFFAYGLGNAMTFPLWVGGTAVLAAEKPTPALTFEIIERFRSTLYFGVPTLYAAQLAALEDANPDLSSLRGCVSAGEALPAELYHRWLARTGLKILDGIGSTEALHIYLSNTFDNPHPGTSGVPVPGYEVRIVGDDGEVSMGDSGRLQVRGPSTAVHYWNKPEKTAATFVDGGWLETGDTYHQDEEGFFVYEGRSDDMMKVGGIWTSPIEIEAALIEHADVLESAVVGRADQYDLIKPEAWVVLREGVVADDDLEQELVSHVKSRLAPYKFPRWWQFVDSLPKTATGKIQRFKLRQT